jgi:hypothetical protein
MLVLLPLLFGELTAAKSRQAERVTSDELVALSATITQLG